MRAPPRGFLPLTDTARQGTEAGRWRPAGDLVAPVQDDQGHKKIWVSKVASVVGDVCVFVLHRGDSWHETVGLHPLQRRLSVAMLKSQ